jgi:hypothetical protein
LIGAGSTLLATAPTASSETASTPIEITGL